MHDIPFLILVAAVGLVIGSFIGVLVMRLPKRQSVLWGRSECEYCGHELGVLELIPLLSWVLQRRRCRACGARLSWFYPVIELAAAAIAVLAALFTSGPVLAGTCLAGWMILGLIAWALSSA